MSTLERMGLEGIAEFIHGPVVIGGSAALVAAGWTCQLHRIPDLFHADPDADAFAGARQRRRPPEVMGRLIGLCAPDGFGSSDIPVLSPAAAIADGWIALSRGWGVHLLDPDDLDPDLIEGAERADLERALDVLGANARERRDCLAAFGDLFGEGQEPASLR